jgi:hypothetical protein
MRHRKRYLASLCIVAAIFVPAAFGWTQTYEQKVIWGPSSEKASATNSITFNYVSWTDPHGGSPQMGTTLCTPQAVCYAWRWSNTGLITDERSISYGFAACKANGGNQYVVYVQYCATGNT